MAAFYNNFIASLHTQIVIVTRSSRPTKYYHFYNKKTDSNISKIKAMRAFPTKRVL